MKNLEAEILPSTPETSKTKLAHHLGKVHDILLTGMLYFCSRVHHLPRHSSNEVIKLFGHIGLHSKLMFHFIKKDNGNLSNIPIVSLQDPHWNLPQKRSSSQSETIKGLRFCHTCKLQMHPVNSVIDDARGHEISGLETKDYYLWWHNK